MAQHTTINNSTNCGNNTHSFNNVWNNNYTVADDRPQILTWLYPLEPRLRHNDVRDRRVDNVGEWLLKTKEFKSWYDWSREGDCGNAVLFCYGDPGAGKTFISSLVVDKLCDEARGQNTAVACFYFDFAARKEQTATNMLGSLLKQMVSGMERIPEEISRAYEEQKAIGGRAPRLPEIVKMLQSITSSQRTFICIDALDECATGHRVKILDSLKQILDHSPGTRIFVTGRPHIQAEIEKRLAGRVICLSVCPSKNDIVRYLRVRLNEDETPDAMDESLEADILKEIPEAISEIFLLVNLNIEAILHESTVYRRRQKLRTITDGGGLGDAYGATIERIKAQDGDKSRLGMAALMWICHAERPLHPDELCHALAVELDSTDFNIGNIPSISTLVGCAQGLITVDKEASTVRLIHFTLQEYLSAHPDLFNSPHSTMAETCLTYLNSQQVKTLSAHLSPDLQVTPFLRYCSIHWGAHIKRQFSESAKSLALKLLEEYDYHVSSRILLEQLDYFHPEDLDVYSGFTGLHCASFLGIVEIAAALIEMECLDINEGDCLGYTPLSWAAYNGHEEVVKILLARVEVDPDKPTAYDQTPLSFAALNGHVEVVKILLARVEVDPDKPTEYDQTPLSLAALNGHVEVVKILLAREEVDPDKPTEYDQTPLSLAAENGHVEVVKILLARVEVDPDKSSRYGGTPLSLAALNGHVEVVKILLAREEVDPDKSSKYGGTPLSFAAWNGHVEVVKILLAREEVDPDKSSKSGGTPLSLAAQRGHVEVVKILLAREEVDPDKPDNGGDTPLKVATRRGHKEVVALLESHKAGNPSATEGPP